MEKQFALAANGQELQKADVELVASEAALADDRVLWEFLRLLPGSATPQKAVLPFGRSGHFEAADSPINSNGMVVGNRADGSVHVAPFRAVIGSTTLAASSVIENVRGIRSGYHVGSSNPWSTVALTANASGNPRWTLVYAIVTPAATGDESLRYRKDPTSKVVSSTTVQLNTQCTVTIGTVNGTPAGSPTRPTLPADGGGAYNIPLAYVWVPTGFTASTIVDYKHIHEVAPCVPILSSMGVPNIAPANGAWTVGGAIDTRQGHGQATRPGAYLPSTMVGGEQRIVTLQLSFTPTSHNDGDVVDDSVDWRYRYFQWKVSAKTGNNSGAAFASDRNGSGAARVGSATLGVTSANFFYHGMGQSFYDDQAASSLTISNCGGLAVYLTNTVLGTMSGQLGLYVDSVTGALKLKHSGSPGAQFLIWLESTGPFSNYGTI